MKLKIPFYESPDEYHCGEAALRSVLKFFFPEKEFSYKELDKLTEHNNGSWTTVIARVLHDSGLKVIQYAAPSLGEAPLKHLERLERGEFHNETEKENAKVISPYIKRCVKFLTEKNMLKLKNLSIMDIEKKLYDGCIIIAMIDYYKLYPKEIKEPPFGHTVVLTGYDSENIFFHENIPKHAESDKRIKKDMFMKIWRNDVDFFGDAIVVCR